MEKWPIGRGGKKKAGRDSWLAPGAGSAAAATMVWASMGWRRRPVAEGSEFSELNRNNREA